MMKKMIAIAVLVMGLVACSNDFFADGSVSSMTSKTMSTNLEGVLIKQIVLMAREEKKTPSGVAPDRDRPIAFASVLVEFENTLEVDTKVVIQSIQIQDNLGRVQLADSQSQTIPLRPLEISANQFELTNKVGYSNLGKVSALVTIQVGDRTQKIKSEPVAIERHSRR